MNKEELINEVSNVSSKLTNRIDQLGQSLTQPEVKGTKHERSIQELLTQATAYGIAVVELVKAVNNQQLKSIAEVNSSIELIESVKKFLALTDRLFD
ncbi:hypothetical protein OCF84_21215 (plasmid) [Shewanella xiamenensis]|uniref:Uncharacterized protein n=1 Tax=Shewanella xiamenensis TaxID=332186 RepID=A0ABT6UDQ8_9GAMM|nr:hypothetical protein [Shewanella xiamenensis]MDI5832603.1 hypothetical protein [Shewanella xiamenensis]WHF57779.1 hypothetical protein OCF84_21215 [Shewanella xiamenensis]